MEKYSWDFNENAEIWDNDSFDTIEECIADAKEYIAAKHYPTQEAPTKIFIGENVPYLPTLDGIEILEGIENQAYDYRGEIAENWEAGDTRKPDEINELGEKLTEVVNEWLYKYGYSPDFWSVEDIQEVKING